MIIASSAVGSKELAPIISRLGVKCDLMHIDYGDFIFEGRGPKGPISIAVERKALHDMLHCIEDSRYSGHQKIGMRNDYDVSVLMVEGLWRAHDPEGWLMEFFPSSNQWGYCKPGGKRVLYSKLRRYLFSVALAGVIVMYTRDMFQTAYDVCELYHYFSKPWDKHTSLLEVQKLQIPDLRVKPPLVRKWANDIEDIGVKYSLEAERKFKTPIRLATSDEMDWLGIPGIGIKTAQKVIKEIHGYR